MQATVRELYVYYIKSCQATRLDTAVIGPRGIVHDREWMIVDAESGVMITQREIPELGSIMPALTPEGLVIRIPRQRHPSVTVPRQLWQSGETVVAKVWNDECLAVDQGAEINQALSVFCQRPVRLVRMSNDHHRTSRRLQEDEAADVGFADAYPFLLTSLASLRELNTRAGQPFQMNRFRPNIVVDSEDIQAFAEDEWSEFTIKDVRFRGVKPCARCVIVNTNQHTGLRSKEPLASLSKFRRERKNSDKVLFGMNLNHLNSGTISVGDPINEIVLGARPAT